MKNIFLKSILSLFAIATLMSSCVNSDTYGVPENILQTYELTPTKTVAQIAALNTSSTPVQITGDEVIEAYVTSSDEKGNFYKSISFQDFKNTSTTIKGFSVPVNITTLYGKGFNPGRKIYINLKGLYIAKIYGSTQIGYLYEGSIGRIPENVWQNHLFPSATVVPESELVREMTVSTAFDDVFQNTLIDLKPVQFEETSLNRTFYDVDSGGGATNHAIVATTGGSSRILRISSFAPFSGNKVPNGSGTIRGVLTKYDTNFQFMIRYQNDIKLSNPRIIPPSNPLGGNALVFGGTLSENFSSYSVGTNTFTKYLNDYTIGGRYWAIKSFSSNSYIEMTAFGGGGVTAKSYFMVPVDFTTASTFTFKKLARFFNGAVLKVFYVKSENFTPGFLDVKKFTEITSSFTISYPANGSSESSFNSADIYTIPANLTGNGYFVFEYSGTPTLTTTMQIDDIVIN